MTPEQEQRLGEMMVAEARLAGHVSKQPQDSYRDRSASQELFDAGTKDLILRFLTQAQEPVPLIEIIKHLNVGTRTIYQCLKRLADEGLIRRIQTRTTTHWEAFK
jgi:DNA-binding GntR family transcriptional regulator